MDMRWSPTIIKALKDFNIIDIASGAGHSMAVDDNHKVYSWGASADF